MFSLMIVLAAATPDKPTHEQLEKWCIDGTISTKDARCPATATPSEPLTVSIPRSPLLLPGKSRPAKPRGNPGYWVSTIDYPARSLQMEEEGTTGFRLGVGVDGRVNSCTITSSSGFASLDAATCSNITRRARFDPGLDDDGNPIVGHYSNRVTWRIPSGPSYASQIGFDPSGPQAVFGTYTEIDEVHYPLEALEKGLRGGADLKLTISASGVVTDCIVIESSSSDLLDIKSCEIARTWSFLPARDQAGKPIGGTTSHYFQWSLPDAWKQYKRTGVYPPKTPM
jgi:TonB family protein